MTLIATSDDIQCGLDALIILEPKFKEIREQAGTIPLRRETPCLSSLLRIVVGQQVSVASAAAIWAKCQASLNTNDAEALLCAKDETLKKAGLSRAKMKTIRAIATEISTHGLDLGTLAHDDAATLKARLTKIHGVGPWTADIFALVCLGHPDIFPLGDIALQEAVKDVFALPERPKGDRLAAITTKWSPHQAVAARLLWAYYGAMRKRTNPFPV